MIPTTTTVTFGPGPFVYSGNPFTATANVTPGGNATLVYTGSCVNAGACSVTASYAGDATHLPSSATASITITPAPAVVVVTGSGSVVYDGQPHVLTASVTGAGGLSQLLPITGCSSITNAGQCNGDGLFSGDANHAASSASGAITVTPAPAVVVVTGSGSVVYDGQPHLLTASVTGAGGLNDSLPITGCSSITNAGQCNGDGLFSGDANHAAGKASGAITVTLAPAVVVVTGSGSFEYDGQPHLLTASVTGAGGLSQSLPITGCSSITNAGQCNGDGLFSGDANHAASSASGAITITPAPTTTTVTFGAGPFPYTGSTYSATATPASATIVYTGDCVNAGTTCAATATTAGDANHLGSSSGWVSITIDKLTTVTTVTFGSGPFPYKGSAYAAMATPSTATIVYTGDCVNAGTTCTATATTAGDANHLGSTSGPVSITIAPVTTANVLAHSSLTRVGPHQGDDDRRDADDEDESKGLSGRYIVGASCDNGSLTSVLLNGVAVVNGQIVLLKFNEKKSGSARTDRNTLVIRAAAFDLVVTCSGANGKVATSTTHIARDGKRDERTDKDQGKGDDKRAKDAKDDR